MRLLRAPPANGKYSALKDFLLRRFSLPAAERADRLLSFPGLGDGTATDLMDDMLSLLGADDGGFLFPHIFLRQLPPPVRATLAISPSLAAGDYRSLAEEADRILAASGRSTVFAVEPVSRQPATESVERESATVAGVAARRQRRPGLCSFHLRFGAKARRCVPPCTFEAPGNAGAGAVAAVGAGGLQELLFIEDSLSGKLFLVDSGSQKSLLPPVATDKPNRGMGPPLSAANGSPIDTFGARPVTVRFHGRSFQWDFVVASTTVPIIGADFLCAHGLLVDVTNRRLIDAVSFDSFKCRTAGSGPFTHTNVVASGDDFHRLLSRFPSLTTPAFSADVARHGVEHFIPTVGPPVFARAAPGRG